MNKYTTNVGDVVLVDGKKCLVAEVIDDGATDKKPNKDGKHEKIEKDFISVSPYLRFWMMDLSLPVPGNVWGLIGHTAQQ